MGGPGILENGRFIDEFDNFYLCKFMYNGMMWRSSEHLYQALKFKDPAYQTEINREKECYYDLGQSRKHALIDDFENKKEELMYIANREKFSQNQRLKTILVTTTGSITFRKSSPFWNLTNARILMRLRGEFIQDSIVA